MPSCTSHASSELVSKSVSGSVGENVRFYCFQIPVMDLAKA